MSGLEKNILAKALYLSRSRTQKNLNRENDQNLGNLDSSSLDLQKHIVIVQERHSRPSTQMEADH